MCIQIIFVFLSFQNPSHTKLPEIESTCRIPQIRAAKQSKIAKPSGIVGTKPSALPKSLSNDKISQASNLVLNTTKTLFRSRFGKPPEPKSRAKVDPKQPDPPAPVTQNSTFAISRPTLARSDTFNKDTSSVLPHNVDVGNNLTQNVISKLQEQTFTASKPIRMSISPIPPSSSQFAVPRSMSDALAKKLGSHICSTPFRNSPVAKFTTRHPLMPSDSHATAQTMENTTGTTTPPINHSDILANTSEPSFLPFANLSPSTATTPPWHINLTNTDNIADITAPSFLGKCTPLDHLREANVDITVHNDYSTMTTRSNATEDDESTIKSTTQMLCLGDKSRHENTLVALVPDGEDVMEIDDRGSTAPCGMYENISKFLLSILKSFQVTK